MKMKKYLALVLASAMALGLTACGGSDNSTTAAAGNAPASGTETSAAGGSAEAPAPTGEASNETLRVAVIADPGNFRYDNPTDYNAPMMSISALPLVEIGKDYSYQNVTASEITLDEDGKGVTIVLRDDLYYTDGTKATASDLAWMFEMLSTGGSSKTFEYIDVANIEVKDDVTVHVPFFDTSGVWLSTMAQVRLYSKEAYDKTTDEQFWLNPVGIGPYSQTDWVNGDSLTYTRNEYYYGDTPYYETILFRVISEQSVATMELEGGNIDVIATTSTEEVKTVQGSNNPNIVIEEMNGVTAHYVGLNETYEPFQDLRVRQAIAYSIDKDLLIAGAADGAAVRSDSCVGPVCFGYINDYEGEKWPYQYDPAKAKELLAEAGYPDGLDVSLLVDGTAIRVAMGEQLQNMMAEAGIRVSIDSRDFASATEILTTSPNQYQMYLRGAGVSPGSECITVIMMPMVLGLNHYELADTYDEFQALGSKIQAASDNDERAALYAEFQQKFVEEWLYWVPTIVPTTYWMHSSNVAGMWRASGTSFHFNEAYAAQ